jgi:ubiquinone/menaquinone biosynthesis C-methylase UbiE
MDPHEFWSAPDVVARFRDREPDIHLMSLLAEVHELPSLRTLDLGCAGGRNAVALGDLMAPVTAIDASHPMCVATRERVGTRVARARMDRIPCRSSSFELVLALGIYHQADSDDEVRHAFAETERVLRPGGAVLLSVFSTEMLGPNDRAVPGATFSFETATRGRVVRFSPKSLRGILDDLGFEILRPLEVRRGTAERGPRISLVGLFGLPPVPIRGPGNRDEVADGE